MNRRVVFVVVFALALAAGAPARALPPLLCLEDEDCLRGCEDEAAFRSTAFATDFAAVVPCCGRAGTTADCQLWAAGCACLLRDGAPYFGDERAIGLDSRYATPDGESGVLDCLYEDRRGHGCLLTPAEVPATCDAHAGCQAVCDLLAGRIEAADAAPVAHEVADAACLEGGGECGCLFRTATGCYAGVAPAPCDTDLHAGDPPVATDVRQGAEWSGVDGNLGGGGGAAADAEGDVDVAPAAGGGCGAGAGATGAPLAVAALLVLLPVAGLRVTRGAAPHRRRTSRRR